LVCRRCHVERSRDIPVFDLNGKRFDSLTPCSLSLWPSRPCRGLPSCSILDSARNDKREPLARSTILSAFPGKHELFPL
jgi:hypothetical protein